MRLGLLELDAVSYGLLLRGCTLLSSEGLPQQMVLQPLLVQQITPGEPHPFVDDPPDVREAKLLRDVLVMGSDVLERILSHQALEVPILLDDTGGVEIVNIRAFHAERNEKLTTYKEPTPALHCERYALVLRPKSVAKLTEANFLDDLETVD